MNVGNDGGFFERLYALRKALKLDFGGQPFLITISPENVQQAFSRLEEKYPDVAMTLDHFYGLTGRRNASTSSSIAHRLGMSRQGVSDRLRRGHLFLRADIASQWHEVLKQLAEKEFGTTIASLPSEAEGLTIDDLKLRVRTRNFLINHGLTSVPAILEKDALWFLDRKQKAFGHKSLDDLVRALRRHGLSLR